MSRRSLILGCVLALGSVAHADDEDLPQDSQVSKWAVSLDVAVGTYIDTTFTNKVEMVEKTETVTQNWYFIGGRGLIYDGGKKTPLGHLPGVWLDFQIGWIGDASAGESGDLGDAGGGGLLWNMKIAGPWQFHHSKALTVGAGIGFGFGMQMGMPNGIDRVMEFIAADAMLMSVVEIKLGGIKTLFEGEYAAGAGYNEQRVYGRVKLGKLLLGGMALAGQANINYFMFGVNLGLAFESAK